MNEIEWLKNLKSAPLPEDVDVSRSVMRDVRMIKAQQASAGDTQDVSLAVRIWAAMAGVGAVASVGIGLMAFDVWQSVNGASADLFTLWDVVMR